MFRIIANESAVLLTAAKPADFDHLEDGWGIYNGAYHRRQYDGQVYVDLDSPEAMQVARELLPQSWRKSLDLELSRSGLI